jgi:hypothetical protein
MRKVSSLSTWHRLTICTHTGKSSLSGVCGDLESKCGRQLEKEIDVDAQMRFAWFSVWTLPSSHVKVTSNKLLDFNDLSSSKFGCRFSGPRL